MARKLSKVSVGEAGCFGLSCGCIILVLVFNLTIGGWMFDYSLHSILGKDIPWYGDMICGLFLAEVLIPVTIICFLLQVFGVAAPFIH